MSVMYEINGYDRKTGDLILSFDVPERRSATVMKIALIPKFDDGLGSYPLDARQVSEIASLLERPVVSANLDYFLEPYEAPQKAAG